MGKNAKNLKDLFGFCKLEFATVAMIVSTVLVVASVGGSRGCSAENRDQAQKNDIAVNSGDGSFDWLNP